MPVMIVEVLQAIRLIEKSKCVGEDGITVDLSMNQEENLKKGYPYFFLTSLEVRYTRRL